jgi:hypothetical protein
MVSPRANKIKPRATAYSDGGKRRKRTARSGSAVRRLHASVAPNCLKLKEIPHHREAWRASSIDLRYAANCLKLKTIVIGTAKGVIAHDA